MKILRRLRRWFGPDPNRFLREAHGVIHVGANVGQEREIYARRNLDVLWVEPLPEVFGALRANIASYPRQRALEALVTDRDDQPYEFHVANNAGESSSIFDLKEHRDLWPKVAFTRSMTLRSVTLTTLLARENIDTTRYDALVMDTQGSELLVLKGAEPLLPRFAWIKAACSSRSSARGWPPGASWNPRGTGLPPGRRGATTTTWCSGTRRLPPRFFAPARACVTCVFGGVGRRAYTFFKVSVEKRAVDAWA
jgi:FkbM family methyltransferase